GELLDSPTLLLFEDVHWMDDASSELLRFLGTQLPTRPWLTCTTRRPGDDGFAAANGTPPLPALTLRLEAIPEDDAKILVRAAAGAARTRRRRTRAPRRRIRAALPAFPARRAPARDVATLPRRRTACAGEVGKPRSLRVLPTRARGRAGRARARGRGRRGSLG